MRFTKIHSLFIIGFVISAMPISFAPKNYSLQVITWMATAALVAVAAVAWARTGVSKAMKLVASVFIVGFIAKIAYDTSIDRTSHNLLPFELAWVAIVTLIPAALLAFLAQWIVKKQAHSKNDR